MQARRRPLRKFARHQINAAQHVGQAVVSLVPSGTRTHLRAAAREWLLSFGVFFDEAADLLGNDAPKARASQAPPQKVKVKVE